MKEMSAVFTHELVSIGNRTSEIQKEAHNRFLIDVLYASISRIERVSTASDALLIQTNKVLKYTDTRSILYFVYCMHTEV